MSNKTIYALCVIVSLVTAGLCGEIAGLLLFSHDLVDAGLFTLAGLANAYNSHIAHEGYMRS